MAHAGGLDARAVARGLGWFSVGLGLIELAAPGALARNLGLERREGLIRAYGARELATGVGILTQDDPRPWIWGRVAGDALDLATLASGLDRGNPERANVGVAMLAVAGVTLLDAWCARALEDERREIAARPLPYYGDRSGLPASPSEMRGAARDLEVPADFRIPEPLRPYAA